MTEHRRSHFYGTRRSEGRSRIVSAAAVLVLAALGLGACSAEVRGLAIPRPTTSASAPALANDGQESLRKEHVHTLVATNGANPTAASDDSWGALRTEKAAVRSLAAARLANAVITSDDSWDSLRREHRATATGY